METYVLSDLHLSAAKDGGLYAGGDALLHFISRLAQKTTPARVILNGDTFDFLAEEGELTLDVPLLTATAQRLVSSEIGAALFRQLGRVLAHQGQVIVRLGNHDLELALPAVQQQLRRALHQPNSVAERLEFSTGDRPLLLDVGGVRVLVTHGEHDDPFNQVDYSQLLASTEASGVSRSSFRYPAGSLLMRKIVAPMRARYGLHFLDYLKPDFQGAALAAMAIAPEACRELFQRATWDIAWQLLRYSPASVAFCADVAAEPSLGLAERVAEQTWSGQERSELSEWLLQTDEGVSFAPAGLGEKVRGKLLDAGLAMYARLHRAAAGSAGKDFFSLTPQSAEARWAQELGARHGAAAVLTGHSHAARFWHGADCLYINSGTWIWLMRPPPPEATADKWQAWLRELQHNPGVVPAADSLIRKECSLNVVTVTAQRAGGARLALFVCQENGTLQEVRAGELLPAAVSPIGKGVAHV